MILTVHGCDYVVTFEHETYDARAALRHYEYNRQHKIFKHTPKGLTFCAIYAARYTKRGKLYKKLVKIASGQVMCHPKDTFDRAEGRKRSLKLALEDYRQFAGFAPLGTLGAKQFRTAFWQAYFAQMKQIKESSIEGMEAAERRCNP